MLWFTKGADPSSSILGGSHQSVQDLLDEAREGWEKARQEQVSVYASDARNEWRLITSRRKRPLGSIILDSGVKEAILDDALDFLDSKEWYSERGIPFRRGYLLVSHLPYLHRRFEQLLTNNPHLSVRSSWIRKDLPHPKHRRGAKLGRLCHFALSSRVGR